MKTNILVVDDDRDFTAILSEYFAMVGVTSCVVAHSLGDVQNLESIPQDLALIDINLGANAPSGVDVHRWLDEHGFRGPIVYLTGHARTSPLVAEALELPNVTVLSKPVSVDRLASLVR